MSFYNQCTDERKKPKYKWGRNLMPFRRVGWKLDFGTGPLKRMMTVSKWDVHAKIINLLCI